MTPNRASALKFCHPLWHKFLKGPEIKKCRGTQDKNINPKQSLIQIDSMFGGAAPLNMYTKMARTLGVISPLVELKKHHGTDES